MEAPTETVSLNLSEVKEQQWQLWEINPVGPREKHIGTLLFIKSLSFDIPPFLHHLFNRFIINVKKKHKERIRCPPINIYRNTIILRSHKQSDHAPCSVSKFNLVTLSLEPLFISKAIKSIYLYTKGISFFFPFLQTTIICFKSQSSSSTSLMLQWRRCFRLQGREG